MKYGVILIENQEKERLNHIISMSKYKEDKSYKDAIQKLLIELESAKFLSNEEMPKDVIRFNSIVKITTPFKVSRTYQIVSPEKSNIKENKISVLAPMGLALFGYAKGDRLSWKFPTGENQITIEDVHQESITQETKAYD